MPISRRFVHIFVPVLIAITTVVFWPKPHPYLDINGQRIQIEIAETDTARQKGLGERASLPENKGMLFIFNDEGFHGIWMKDMLIKIDVLWLDQSGRIVDMENDLSPSTYPAIFRPETTSRYVLELNENAIELFNIKAGDKVDGL